MTFYYFIIFLISVVVGYKVALKLVNDNSTISMLIRVFAGVGITFSIFGVLFLGINAINNDKDQWEQHEKIINQHTKSEYIKEIKIEKFDIEILKFNDNTIQTASMIFTIAGIFLGALGILWLGQLEATRLRNDREHDQNKQKDRLLSLLSLGIDLFFYIDKHELDFMYETKNKNISKNKKDTIQWKDKYYFLLTNELKNKNNKLKIPYEQHLTSLYKFLYQGKNFKRNTVLEDIYKIIEELQILYYEKDMLLYYKQEDGMPFDENIDNQFSKKREIYIELLNEYSDYKNFINGNTIKSDFFIHEYEIFDKKLSTLLNSGNDLNEQNPIKYLKEKYNKKDKIFYEYFQSSVSKEFIELYLIKESDIFSIFNIISLKDVFEMMNISYLDAEKFFNSYFQKSFNFYINEKKEYTAIDLSKKDLNFEEYIEIIQKAFLQIDADIKSVKELYGLFSSFVKLYNIFNDGAEYE